MEVRNPGLWEQKYRGTFDFSLDPGDLNFFETGEGLRFEGAEVDNNDVFYEDDDTLPGPRVVASGDVAFIIYYQRLCLTLPRQCIS